MSQHCIITVFRFSLHCHLFADIYMATFSMFFPVSRFRVYINSRALNCCINCDSFRFLYTVSCHFLSNFMLFVCLSDLVCVYRQCHTFRFYRICHSFVVIFTVTPFAFLSNVTPSACSLHCRSHVSFA